MGEMNGRRDQGPGGGPSRREVLGRGAAFGLSVAASPGLWTGPAAAQSDVPTAGGTLRLGLGGGSTTDTLNPLSWTDSVMIDVGFGLYNCLVENSADNRPVPELAEHYEAKPGAADWIFTLRRGVAFSNGKAFDADDAIYSLNLHRGPTISGAAGPMKAVTDIRKLGTYQLQISLAGGDADFPTTLTDYHIVMVPNGFADWSRPVGTGAYALAAFEPGVRIGLQKTRPYWKDGRGHLDAVDYHVINETSARMSALIAGDVDAINRADPRTVSRIARSPTLEIVRAAGGWFPIMAMQVDRDPYTSLDLRKALKYALDREQMIKTLFAGYGSLGNDHPIPRGDPYFNTQLAQITYDPDKAKSYFRKAGLSDPKIVLQASDAAFNGALAMAGLLQTGAGKAGIPMNVKADPADGYFETVWLKAAFVASYWGGRPAATQMLGLAYASDASWNETHWKNARFDTMLADAKAETDDDRRKALIWDMQAMLSEESGSLIPCFRDWLDAQSRKVGGHTPHSGFDMCNGRIAEKAFLRP